MPLRSFPKENIEFWLLLILAIARKLIEMTEGTICKQWGGDRLDGAVAGLVGIECGVVSGVINLESSGVEASDWRPRHDEHYMKPDSLQPAAPVPCSAR